jgi:mono/diheme cytochrome c family protein
MRIRFKKLKSFRLGGQIAFEVLRALIGAVFWGGLSAIAAARAGATPPPESSSALQEFKYSVTISELNNETQLESDLFWQSSGGAVVRRVANRLLIASSVSTVRADTAYVAAHLKVVDVASGDPIKDLFLPNGSTSVTDLEVSPDGKHAVITHLVADFTPPAATLFGRWMNGNALTLIDLSDMEVLGSVLLDDPGRGAANPSAAAWSPDGKTLVVTHAGTHEISVIDYPALVSAILEFPAPTPPGQLPSVVGQSGEAQFGSYLRFFPSPRKRIKLSARDLGPRDVTFVGNTAYISNYFSETVTSVDLSTDPPALKSICSGPKKEWDLVKKGEFYFHDATICYQGWQSCASCHPNEGRADGLNWDLLNDGVGNPKNTKSLLYAHLTPPAMSLGVRETAETAVRSGIKHILFTRQPEEVGLAIDAYLKSLTPVPSPHLVNGQLSPSAQRGKQVFDKAGCAACHPPGLFTNRKAYDVGTRNAKDKPTDKFDTPTLVEIWRTAPYLHDGSAATLREVVTLRNQEDKHGRTSRLSSKEIDDLIAYLLSL